MSADAFVDPPVMLHVYTKFRWLARIKHRLRTPQDLTEPQRIIIAETKQAICSLAEVGAKPHRPYLVFPKEPQGVAAWLERLPWRTPWGAGAQSCQLAAFLRTQGPEAMETEEVEGLCDAAYDFLAALVDDSTGAYFQGHLPERGQLINGAMKVLTALDWLERPIHRPERLIDTCLAELPSPQGCHLVDLVYVLHRCVASGSEHRRAEVRDYCLRLLEMIRRHHQPDGGFSYYIGRTQLSYYGLPITRGLDEGDIHGTVLLVWALAMILAILEEPEPAWRVIKP
jgi:hypothetical protein